MSGADSSTTQSPWKMTARAREIHADMLALNNAIARLRLSPSELAQWRAFRDGWQRWYGSTTQWTWWSSGVQSALNDFAQTLNSWRGWYARRTNATAPRALTAGVESMEHLNENQWGAVSGLDEAPAAGCRVRGVWNQTGNIINAWMRIDFANGRHVLLHGTTDLETIEREMLSLPQSLPPEVRQEGAASGLFGINLKKLIRKTGIAKVARGLTKVAKAAINNPLIKTALMATPVGQVAYAVQAGARVVQGALKGNLNAKNFLNFALKQAMAGNPSAAAALKLLRAGARQMPGIARYVPRMAAASGAYDRQWVGMCAGDAAPVPDEHVMIDEDGDAIMTMASAGAFEGMRWAFDRLGWHSMTNNPDAFGTRDALLLGREAAAARFA